MKRFIFILFLLKPSLIWAQCDGEYFRQFDFWLGQWQVFTPDGKKAGSNHIATDLNLCVLIEHYVTASGYEGRSLNIYDQQQQSWHQTWVDNSGLLLKLDGQYQHGQMVLTGSGKNAQGQTMLHKISWTPQANGDVRQHWQTSNNKGQNWQTVFDGLYKKLPKSE